MSLLTSTVYRELEGVVVPREDTSTYTLARSGAGWTLLIRFDPSSPSGWSTPLAPHGAGAEAPVRVAQAVGVRVLAELGVEVAGWRGEPGEDADEFVATTTASTRPRLRGLRGH